MNYAILPYRIFPLGDSALTIDFGNSIDEALNAEVIARFNQFCLHPFAGIIEAIPAYSSLTIHYDILALNRKIPAGQTVYEWVRIKIEEQLKQPVSLSESAGRQLQIPVCYDDEFGLDMLFLASSKNITRDEVIRLHTAKKYKVYMLGFLPGFSYMGEVDEKISMPRKPQPVTIPAGSVGIAGKQTGIYPLTSPGGWQIIGRTPLKLFDPHAILSQGEASAGRGSSPLPGDSPALLRAGDLVEFYSISKKEFERIGAGLNETG